jgi:hypothetical protein
MKEMPKMMMMMIIIIIIIIILFLRDMVCLRSICVDTLHKGDTEEDDNDNNNNNGTGMNFLSPNEPNPTDNLGWPKVPQHTVDAEKCD